MANQVDAGHMFLQQHTHPTFHVLRSLDQQMYACYSQPEIPTLPTPVEGKSLGCPQTFQGHAKAERPRVGPGLLGVWVLVKEDGSSRRNAVGSQ